MGLTFRSAPEDDLTGNPGTCLPLSRYDLVVRRKDLAMVRLLSIVVFSALCFFSDQASASAMKQPESLASDISSRQRCVCSTSSLSGRIVRYRNYRVRTAYLIGYDPLPYRFGSTFVWEPPYRYYRH